MRGGVRLFFILEKCFFGTPYCTLKKLTHLIHVGDGDTNYLEHGGDEDTNYRYDITLTIASG